MRKYIIRRLLWGIVVMWLVSVIIFSVSRIGPDPVLMMAPPDASEADLNTLRERYALDKPFYIQYFTFISKAVQGDLGESLYFGVPVSQILLKRLPATLELVFAAQLVALCLGISAGVLAAISRRRWVGGGLKFFSLLGLSLPNFWVALMMLLFFSVYLEILPTSGRGGIEYLVMPALSLGWYASASYTRLTNSSLLGALNQEYVKLARAKGLPERLVIGKHALRNALIPTVTLAGMSIVVMISAAVAIETVFAWPGLGYLLYDAASNRDFNTVQGVIILISGMVVLLNLIVDILYAYLDPRIRYI